MIERGVDVRKDFADLSTLIGGWQRHTLRNALQQGAICPRAASQQKTAYIGDQRQFEEMRKNAAPRENTEPLQLGDIGLELNYVTPCNDKNLQDSLESGGAKSGASTLIEADLQQLVEAWSSLPKNIRSAIVAIVQNGAD